MRPLWGDVFKDYLERYRFWGHCDIDVFWGNIKAFINDDLLSRYDIISGDSGKICGPFTIYRNIPKINKLYTYKKDYRNIIEDIHRHYKFNEIGMTELLKKNSANLGIEYLFKNLQEHSTAEKKFYAPGITGKY